MTMSKDRVKFLWTTNDNGQNESIRAFTRAMGSKPPLVFDYNQPRVIVCRPSQFARFLIYRNNNGGANGFKHLQPELVPCEDCCVTDVSHNPA